MRRIILALSFLTLTACDPARAPDDAGVRDAVADAAVEAEGRRSGQADARVRPGDGSAPAAARDSRVVLFVGTSLTAGYGVGDHVAYPAVVQAKIDSAGLPFRVVNAGISGETSAGGLRRIEWSLQQPTDVLVLELGANDALRGLDVARMRENLDSILTLARRRYPDIALVLVGMQAPPNLGPQYTARFSAVYRDLAREHGAALVPFLLEGVAAEPGLNIEDGVHPNIAGHRMLARTVWATLEPVLRRRAAAQPAASSDAS